MPARERVGSHLVAGAAGFIGAAVAAELLDAGHAVLGVDDLNDTCDVRLKHWRLDRLAPRAGFTFRRADVSDRAALAAACGAETRFDSVFNLAARAGVRASVDDPWACVDANVTGTLNLLDLCRERGVRKFVLASTSSLYDARGPMPHREDADTSRASSPYAATKQAAEGLCHAYHRLFGLDVTVFRYFTVYGPAGRPDMSLFRFVQWVHEGRPVRLYGDGSQSRDFTYVDDVARGTVAGLAPLGCEVVNLGAGAPVPLREVLRFVESRVGRAARVVESPPHPADAPATWADIAKARRLLGWTPRTAWQDGVQRLVDWYAENRSWARQVGTSDGGA